MAHIFSMRRFKLKVAQLYAMTTDQGRASMGRVSSKFKELISEIIRVDASA